MGFDAQTLQDCAPLVALFREERQECKTIYYYFGVEDRYMTFIQETAEETL